LFFSLFLLVIVLFPGIGRVVNGSRRWLHLGFLTLQVSELVKLSALLYLSGYLQRHLKAVQTETMGFIKPLLFLGIIACLLLLEPDFGAMFVISAMFLGVLFIAGVRLRGFLAFLMFGMVAMSLLAMMAPYRMERLTTFLNPWAAQFGSGYQLTQSLIAFGQGGFWGVGLGNSVQKLFYLPEAHTDFLFAVIGEEWGLIGTFCVIGFFTAMIACIFKIARHAQRVKHLFSSYVAYGAAIWLAIQGMINMGVNVGVLPTKGLTLPFISYGGSSLLVNCILIGILLRIAHETRWAR